MSSTKMSARLIIEQTVALHRRQFSLCSRLEAVADGLPTDVDRQECLLLARDLYPGFKRAHDYEESELFPFLQRHLPNARLDSRLERLQFEHWEDEAHAEDICDALDRIGRGAAVTDADRVSWMLRGFFGGVRRHIAYERDHLIPMLQPLSSIDANFN